MDCIAETASLSSLAWRPCAGLHAVDEKQHNYVRFIIDKVF